MSTTTDRRAMARGLAVVGVATLVGNGAAFGLSMVAARVLTPAEFGGFGALLGLTLIVATLAIAMQATVARRVATAGSDRPLVEGRSMRLAVLVAAVVALGGLVVAWPLGPLLAIPVGVAAVGLLAQPFVILGFAAMGVAQGREQHSRLAGGFLSNGVLRALGGLAGVVAVGSLMGATAGILVGCAAGALGAVAITRPQPWAPSVGPGALAEFAHTAHALIVLYALTNVDVLLARIYLSPDESGEYAVGVLLAKIAFFLPNAIVIVLFPRMAAAGSTRRPLLYAAALTAAVGVVITAFSFAFGPLVVRVLGGTPYPDLGSIVWLFALEGSAFALVQVLLYARLAAQDRRAVLLVWAALVALVVIVVLWRHDSMTQIVTTVVAVSLVPTVVAIVLDRRRRNPSDDAPLPMELAE